MVFRGNNNFLLVCDFFFLSELILEWICLYKSSDYLVAMIV